MAIGIGSSANVSEWFDFMMLEGKQLKLKIRSSENEKYLMMCEQVWLPNQDKSRDYLQALADAHLIEDWQNFDLLMIDETGRPQPQLNVFFKEEFAAQIFRESGEFGINMREFVKNKANGIAAKYAAQRVEILGKWLSNTNGNSQE